VKCAYQLDQETGPSLKEELEKEREKESETKKKRKKKNRSKMEVIFSATYMYGFTVV